MNVQNTEYNKWTYEELSDIIQAFINIIESDFIEKIKVQFIYDLLEINRK